MAESTGCLTKTRENMVVNGEELGGSWSVCGIYAETKFLISASSLDIKYSKSRGYLLSSQETYSFCSLTWI